jgi:hypothetical protein
MIRVKIQRSTPLAVLLFILLAVVGCDSASDGNSAERGAAQGTVRQGQPVDYRQEQPGNDYDSMNCGQLLYLARKYSSIADSALRASGDSPAVVALQMQGIQAANLASRLYGIMSTKGCPSS